MRAGTRVMTKGGTSFLCGVVEEYSPQPNPWQDLVKVRVRQRILGSYLTGWEVVGHWTALPGQEEGR